MLKTSYNILGVKIDNLNLNQILEKIKKGLRNSDQRPATSDQIFHIVTVNPEFLVLAQENSVFKNILNRASLSLPDGIGILLAGVLTGQRFKERITGVRLMKELCHWAVKEGLMVGLIGGRPGIAVAAGECLEKKYPGLKWWAEEGPQIKAQSSKLKAQINSKSQIPNSKLRKTDILFVAMGAPKQEFFIEVLRKRRFNLKEGSTSGSRRGRRRF